MFWGFLQSKKKVQVELDKKTASESHKLIEVKDEVIKTLRERADELVQMQRERADNWKAKYDQEHGEFNKYRDDIHTRLNDANALVLKYTAENGELRAKTDLTPILANQQQQVAVNTKVIDSLTKINLILDDLVKRKAA